MTQTTILEKLKIVLDVTMSSNMFIAIIAFIVLLAIAAFTTNKNTINRTKTIYGLVYTAIIAAILVFYHDSLGKMFDYMMNNFFIVLYFPNIAVYLAAIIITNIILLASVFNLKISKLIRTINIVVYSIIHYLLALVLNVIATNDLDIFSQTSIYGNTNAQAIIEISGVIFLTWIIFLTVYKLIRKYQLRGKVAVKRKVIIKKVRALPECIMEVPVSSFVIGQSKKLEAVATKVEKPKLIKAIEAPEIIIGQSKKQKEEPQIIKEIVNNYDEEKTALEQQLEQAMKALKNAEKQIKVQEETIRVKSAENKVLENEQISLQYEQTILQQDKAKLQQDKNKLLQENKKLQEAKDEVLDVKKEQKMDATSAIMNNLDSMFTLEDYKVLATILKDRQKNKNEQKLREQIAKTEQLKFTQLHDVYKGAR